MFRLSKWYLDSIDEAGNPTIIYTGEMGWNRYHLGFSSVLTAEGQRNSLRRAPEPELENNHVRWRCEALGMTGEWHPLQSGMSRTVFASDDGTVEWRCLAPAARAVINGTSGVGYVEHLVMTLPPWRLPLRTLRWGRISAECDAVVWIEWDSRRFVYRNGEEAAVCELTDEIIVFEDGTRICLDRSMILRHGPLGTTALAAIPGLRRTFPSRLLAVTECKWRSRALLMKPGCEPVSAWAIHERVDWPD
jgi:hypothetical protein